MTVRGTDHCDVCGNRYDVTRKHSCNVHEHRPSRRYRLYWDTGRSMVVKLLECTVCGEFFAEGYQPNMGVLSHDNR